MNVLIEKVSMEFNRFERCETRKTMRQDARPQADVGADIDGMPKIPDVGKGWGR